MTKREKLARRRQEEIRVLRWALMAVIVFAVLVFSTGFYAGESNEVEELYTVRSGDVLREISEHYLAKNTYDRRYILEFEENIHQLNPWIRSQGGVIYPGQVIRVSYRVKAGEGK